MTKTVAMVWGSEPPAFSIGHEKPMWPGDSGFTVIFSDAPDPDEVHGVDDPRVTLVCLHCLLDDHPELGRGLDIAHKHYNFADLDDTMEWYLRRRPRARSGSEWTAPSRPPGPWFLAQASDRTRSPLCARVVSGRSLRCNVPLLMPVASAPWRYAA